MAARLRPTPDEPRTRLKQVSLFTPTRVAIIDAVAARPGASISDVARAIGRHASTADTNARLLMQAGVIRGERDGRLVRLFPLSGMTEHERARARLGPSEAVYDAIARGVPGHPATLASELGITRHAARYHLKRLARIGAVRAVVVRVLVTRTRFIPADSG